MIQYLYLGRLTYDEALRLQQEIVDLRVKGAVENVLLLLEHPPELTLGRNANRANILASDELLAARGVTLHHINRGGDVTYHGPGQLVGYPIFDLRSLRMENGKRPGPVDFVRMMEEALIRLCGEFGVKAGRICGLTGVWCAPRGNVLDGSCSPKASDAPKGERKIGAIGIHVSRGVTSHGFAFNVTTDLREFGLINPCGITDRPVTSLQQEVAALAATGAAAEPLPDLEAMAHRAARQFGMVFKEHVLAVENLQTLRAQAAARSADQSGPQEFPAEDTPLQIPPEIERLQNKQDRPLNA